MGKLTAGEFLYSGILIVALVLYLTLYIKRRHEILRNKNKSTRWGIIASFAVIGIMATIFHMVHWLYALITSGIACLIGYYVIFIKYKS